MSIWCSGSEVGWDDLPNPEKPQPRGGEVRAYAEGWSNHYPTTDGEVERPASIALASIAPWCVPGWDDGGSLDYPTCGPWLRMDLSAPRALTWWTKDGERPTVEPVRAAVVMDEAAVRQLVTDLNEWLERPKLQPRGDA